eukprot:g3268.t1
MRSEVSTLRDALEEAKRQNVDDDDDDTHGLRAELESLECRHAQSVEASSRSEDACRKLAAEVEALRQHSIEDDDRSVDVEHELDSVRARVEHLSKENESMSSEIATLKREALAASENFASKDDANVWKEAFDEASGKSYWWNTQTNQTSWTKPEMLTMSTKTTTPSSSDDIQRIEKELDMWKERAATLESALEETKRLGVTALEEMREGAENSSQETDKMREDRSELENQIVSLKQERAMQVYEMGQSKMRNAIASRASQNMIHFESVEIAALRRRAFAVAIRRLTMTTRLRLQRRGWQRWRAVVRWCHYFWFKKRDIHFRFRVGLVQCEKVCRAMMFRRLGRAFREWNQQPQVAHVSSSATISTTKDDVSSVVSTLFKTPATMSHHTVSFDPTAPRTNANAASDEIHALRSALATREKDRRRKRRYQRLNRACQLLRSALIRKTHMRKAKAWARWESRVNIWRLGDASEVGEHSVIEDMVDEELSLDMLEDRKVEVAGNDRFVKVFLKSLRDISTENGEGGSKYFDLSKGMPLNTFRKDACVKVRESLLTRSPLFREKLRARKSDDEMIVLELKSIKLVDAYLEVLQHLSPTETTAIGNESSKPDGAEALPPSPPSSLHPFGDRLTFANQFAMFAAASAFKIPELTIQCIEYIEANLTPQSFPIAVQHAIRNDDPRLKRSVFSWLKRLGPLQSKRTGTSEESSPQTRRGRRKSSASSHSKEGETARSSRKLWLDNEMLSVVFDNLVTPIVLFKDIALADCRRCETFTRVGAHTSKIDSMSLDDFLKAERKIRASNDRDGFLGTTKFEIRRTRGLVEASSRRRRGSPRKYVQYDLYRVEDDKYLMSARNYAGSSDFIIASKRDGDFRPHGPNYVGAVCSNFVGTVFTVYDHGMTLPKAFHDACPEFVRREQSVVVYEKNLLGRVPNSMRILLPRVDAKLGTNVSIRERFESERKRSYKGTPAVHECCTRKPIWSEGMEAWTMDFRGRVKIASKKNMQIVCDDIATDEFGPKVILLFGKRTKDVFSLDFGSPFSALTAFGSVLPSFAKKLAVT